MNAPSAARASLALAALLAAPALWPANRPGDCAAPAERAAWAGVSHEVGCGGGRALRGPARLLFGAGLDPNRARPESLEVLPGIGPARARAIVRERCRRPFASAAELVRVAGIGPVTLARVEPWLELRPPLQARCASVD